MIAKTSAIGELQERIVVVENTVQAIYTALVRKGVIEVASAQRVVVNRATLRAELIARGITRAPSPEELAVAAQWRSRPEEEQARFIKGLETLRLDPPLSEIIHRMRA
ncbi:MAG: hypothetical protein AAB427_11300 [Chloroflexota bacterium]